MQNTKHRFILQQQNTERLAGVLSSGMLLGMGSIMEGDGVEWDLHMTQHNWH